MKQTQTLTNRLDSPWGWLALALLAQMGWGAYPVLLRYLQTVSGLPGLSLLAAGNLVVLLIVAAFILPRLDRRIFRLDQQTGQLPAVAQKIVRPFQLQDRPKVRRANCDRVMNREPGHVSELRRRRWR